MTVDNDLARNFGFDITMSEGSMGLPTAAHKEYMERCQFLYKEFITNMGLHMKKEKVLRKELRTLHREKMQHLRFSLYRTIQDPFARRNTQSIIPIAPLGLNASINVSKEPAIRPHTAPNEAHRQLDIIDERPKTAAVDKLHEVYECDARSESSLSEISNNSKSTVAGVIDRRTEHSSARKITVGKATFNKITHGKVRAKLKHRDGRFVVQPVRTEFESEVPNHDTLAYEPLMQKQAFDPLHERLALVRKITDFRTPTISSDMKINNRVPIQKSLRGINAKRTTVSEIYENARERKTRHFRIVTNMPRSKSAADGTVTKQTNIEGRSKSAHPAGRDTNNSRLSAAYGGSREGTPMYMQQRSGLQSQADEVDNIASSMTERQRSKLFSCSSASKSLNESFNGMEHANGAKHISRPQSKVAFSRSDSQMSGNILLSPGNDAMDMSASFSSSLGGVKHFGDKLNVSMISGARPRSISVNSDVTAASNHTDNHVGADGHSSAVQDGSHRGRHGMSPAELKSRGLHRTESKQSLSSIGTNNTSFIQKVKMATEKNNPKGGIATVQKLGFQAPVKMESRKDTVDIIRQQVRQDKQLDERMTVWRRRMAIKSSLMTPRAIIGPKTRRK